MLCVRKNQKTYKGERRCGMNKCIECLYKLDFYKIGIFICGKHQEIVPYNWKMCHRCKDFEKLYLLEGGAE